MVVLFIAQTKLHFHDNSNSELYIVKHGNLNILIQSIVCGGLGFALRGFFPRESGSAFKIRVRVRIHPTLNCPSSFRKIKNLYFEDNCDTTFCQDLNNLNFSLFEKMGFLDSGPDPDQKCFSLVPNPNLPNRARVKVCNLL